MKLEEAVGRFSWADVRHQFHGLSMAAPPHHASDWQSLPSLQTAINPCIITYGLMASLG